MKYISVLFFLLICSVSKAFVYEIDEKNLLNPSQFQAHQFKNHFSKLGYNSVGGLNSLTRARFYFDQAFVSFNWKEAILLKAGLKAPGNMNGVVIEDSASGVKAFHFKLNEKYFLLLGIGMSRNDFEKAVQPWTKTKVSWIKSVFLSTAQADGCNCEFPKNKMQLSAASLEKDSTLQTIGRCATDAWGGLESSVNGTLEFFKKLATDPKTLWLEMKQSFLELKEFVLNLGNELQSLFENISGLSAEEKTALACSFSGQLLGGAAQALLGGAAVAKILPGLLVKSKQIISSIKQIVEFERSGTKLPSKSTLLKQAVNCGI